MSQHLILVVDDDPDVRIALRDALEDEGYEVEVASDGIRALESLRAGKRPSAIVLDLMMPRGDGAFFLQQRDSHEGFRHIPVIVLSAGSKPEEQMAGARAEYMLRKPVGLVNLISTVEAACEKSSSFGDAGPNPSPDLARCSADSPA
jgi:two-component system response regulator MprA